MNFSMDRNAPAHPYRPHWKFCVGSGYAPLALRADYLNLLRRVHRELGIRYVRFHGIFHDDMEVVTPLSELFPGKGSDRVVEWNFHNIGTAYDNILSCGMKPFVELSYMPAALASGSEQCRFYYRGNITPPREDAQWAAFIQAFIRYLLHRYGAQEVRSWFFEVWNEPDLPIFFSGTKADYYRLYGVTARAIKEVDPQLRVGGPATAGSKWIGSFLAYCSDHRIPVDFVSTHQYAGDPIGGMEDCADLEEEYPRDPPQESDYTELLQGLDAGDLLGGLRRLMPDKSELTQLKDNGFYTNASIVRGQAGDKPLFYTEWNANAIFAAWSNDTRKVAAYDLRAALETEQLMEGSSVWCFSDLFEEFHHFPQEFHGGFGLLTSHGIPKPVYHMFRLLAQVGPERLELGEQATRGEIGVAAFRDPHRMQIFLFRQKMTNRPLPPASLQLALKCDEKPESIRLTRIDEERCNPLRLWMERGSPKDLTPTEVQAIAEASAPEPEPIPWSWQEGRVLLDATLQVNDIWYLEAIWKDERVNS